MSVVSIMSQRVVCVHMDDSLETIRELITATGYHHLMVVEGNRLVGVISDRDLLNALSPFVDTLSERSRDRATLERKAHQIMSREPITLSPTSSIVSAIKLFNRHNISCIPVIDEHDKPVGVISWRDILRYAEDMVARKRET